MGASRSFTTDSCSIAAADGSRHPGAREPVENGATGADPPIGSPELALRVSAILVLTAGVVVLVGAARRRKTRRALAGSS